MEIWKAVVGYEGRYQVSSLGRVKSVARMRKGKNGGQVPLPERIMKPYIKKIKGRTRPYAEVQLRDGAERNVPSKSKLVHRLVAEAFIGPLDSGMQVDHINGVHSDNRVENLRIMHYTEHARLHPVLNGRRNLEHMEVMQAAHKAWLAAGNKSGQYVRSQEHRDALKAQMIKRPTARDPVTGKFLAKSNG